MPARTQGKILRLHFSERDRWQGQPLHEAIVQKCREMNISGVTVFRGLEGYGETGEMHERHLAGSDRPVVVVVVDTDERVRNCIPVFEGMITTGVIAMSDIEMIRVRKGLTA
ncbi:MAG TPA: DUF190 domain-containing protein [Bryobacteraceae bacterium]|nr:DUF190 domain-containing protein [Bryobacteraceae bacterium]